MFGFAPRRAMVRVGERQLQSNGVPNRLQKQPTIRVENAPLALFVQNYMSNIRQIEANRLNALKSTGPQTPEGKAAVKLNALRHGLRARTVVLPGENSEDFQQLCDDLETEWNPASRSEQFYVEQMAISQWKFQIDAIFSLAL